MRVGRSAAGADGRSFASRPASTNTSTPSFTQPMLFTCGTGGRAMGLNDHGCSSAARREGAKTERRAEARRRERRITRDESLTKRMWEVKGGRCHEGKADLKET